LGHDLRSCIRLVSCDLPTLVDGELAELLGFLVVGDALEDRIEVAQGLPVVATEVRLDTRSVAFVGRAQLIVHAIAGQHL
jgi:hypothetical protein